MLKFAGWLEAYGKGEVTKAAPLAGEEAQAEEAAAGARRRTTAKELLAEDARRRRLPELARGRRRCDLVDPPGVLTEQKFTQPPPRYNEGSLVRELEERGIGRPSTYAEIISKVQARDYVEKVDGGRASARRLLGKFVVDGLVQSRARLHGPGVHLEDGGGARRGGGGQGGARRRCSSASTSASASSSTKSKKGKRWNPEPEPTDEKCEVDGGEMLKRWSKNGWFLGCANYPECKNTRDLGPDGNGPPRSRRETGIDCDKCGKPMVIRTRALRRVPLVHRLPRVQEREARAARRAVPQVRRRHHRDPPEEARRAARSTAARTTNERVDQVRLQALAEAHRRAVPDVRGAVPRDGRHEGEADDRLRRTRSAATSGRS